ncbi:TPA: hypothetical protein TXZ04_000960 [Streptococcus suis]|uniref:hypothetical protein n=1 Tax=Streptococcus suis TaxID=1307 RepID=UPI00041D0CD3|nr:hypothetical protein [Streptococcus suis]MDW8744774.1 hypothetical protein [Streptococcus suis]HEL1828362.1 hypothetical protein [Streptococcus suis]HEL1998279.1 hypothetical protein [Streptococcus suis]HEL2258420.1 hypothetical protein [Streptococcus suis]HEM3230822.1 hypothetical protein [Streptococcus suis 2726]
MDNTHLLYSYGALVSQLPTIISALDLVSDELEEAGETNFNITVKLELALSNLSHLHSKHRELYDTFEDIYNEERTARTPFDAD